MLDKLGNMKELLGQARQMQSELSKKQKELAKQRFEAESGGGMVKAVVTGSQELVSITIDPSVFSEGDCGMLESLVVSAVNAGLKKAGKAAQDSLSGMMGGLGNLGALKNMFT